MAPGGHAGAAGAGGAVAQVWQEGKCREWAGGAGAQVGGRAGGACCGCRLCSRHVDVSSESPLAWLILGGMVGEDSLDAIRGFVLFCFVPLFRFFNVEWALDLESLSPTFTPLCFTWGGPQQWPVLGQSIKWE